jgi:hypothetical protein
MFFSKKDLGGEMLIIDRMIDDQESLVSLNRQILEGLELVTEDGYLLITVEAVFPQRSANNYGKSLEEIASEKLAARAVAEAHRRFACQVWYALSSLSCGFGRCFM